MHFWSINFSIIYIAALFSISYFFIRKAVHSYEEYNLCGRSLTFAYIIMTYLGTWVGGGSIIGLVGLSYLSGLSNYWVLSIPYLIGFPFAEIMLWASVIMTIISGIEYVIKNKSVFSM